jgi:long-chain acyl-CoA synthetase
VVETFPALFQEKAMKYGNRRVALRHKQFGVWREYTWKDYYEKVKQMSLGLIDLGLQPGDKVMLLGYNDPYLYWAILAVMASQGVATICPPDIAILETQYLLEQSDARLAIVQDQGQVDKLLGIKAGAPNLEKVIFWDPKGMSDYHAPILMSLARLLQRGKEFENAHPGSFEEVMGRVRAEDMALLLFTSGTKGLPKGVPLTHKAGIRSAKRSMAAGRLQEDFEIFSHMPLAWFSAYTLEFGVHLTMGLTANFPEAPEAALADLREIGPQFVMFTARQWESLARQIQIRMADVGFLKRLCYRLFLPLGYEIFEKRGQVPFWSKLLYFLARGLLFRPLKDKLGLLRIKLALTGGSSICPESYRFLNALGLNLKQVYGLVEMHPITWHGDEDLQAESVGLPVTGTEIKISEDGEILAKGDQMFQGYYRNPEATQAVLKNGWLHTGDAGAIDRDGHLIYYDRLSDLIELPHGKKLFPSTVENKLRFNIYIKDALVIYRGAVLALIQLDFETVSKWAERNTIPYTTFADLSQKPQVHDLVGEAVRRVNQTLPEEARVERFFLLSKSLSPDESELTRSGKLRRDSIMEKYRDLWAEKRTDPLQ